MSKRPFDSLTDRGKRLRIAKDVLVQLDTKKIKATRGVYFSADNSKCKFDSSTSVQEVVKKSRNCKACALGALFVCAIRTKNGLTLSDVEASVYGDIGIGSYPIKNRLHNYFDEAQLQLIESAFEGRDFSRYGTDISEVTLQDGILTVWVSSPKKEVPVRTSFQIT